MIALTCRNQNRISCPACGRVVTTYGESRHELVIHTHRIPRLRVHCRNKLPDLCTHSLMPVKLKG